jgi:hypothetical protein
VYVLVDGTPRFAGSAAEFRALPDVGAVFFAHPADSSPNLKSLGGDAGSG